VFFKNQQAKQVNCLGILREASSRIGMKSVAQANRFLSNKSAILEYIDLERIIYFS